MEYKALPIQLKGDTPGSLTAVFARLNVKDLDGDVTLPGAFENGATTRLLPTHDWSSPMIGKGTIRADSKQAVFEGAFNLEMAAGREWYSSLKYDMENGKPLQEFSYGYDVADSEMGQFQGESVRFLKKLIVHEVSPVTLGAGIGTGTVSIKGLKDGTFDEIFAYFDEHPDQALKFIGELAGREYTADPPKSDDSSDDDDPEHGTKFADHAEHVLADVQAFTVRAAAIAALRARSKEGRTFSAANVSRLGSLAVEIEQSAGKLRELLTAEPAPKALTAIEQEYARFQMLSTLYA